MIPRIRKLKPSSAPKGARTHADWRKLMIKAIERARTTGDPRLATLLEAQTKGRQEEVLRRMSIISEADLRREFPDPQT